MSDLLSDRAHPKFLMFHSGRRFRLTSKRGTVGSMSWLRAGPGARSPDSSQRASSAGAGLSAPLWELFRNHGSQ